MRVSSLVLAPPLGVVVVGGNSPSSSGARNACSDLGPNPATSLADAVGTTVEDGEVIRLGHALDAFHVVGAALEYEGVALSQLPH